MNKHGQSTIEYALIAVLVILGIVVMGPYALRSVNAHFKLWDEGVQDSTKENITQAPLADVPPINVNCTLISTIDGGCNTANCGVGYHDYQYTYSPQGCNGGPLDYCKKDQSCCGLPVNLNCGSSPLNQPLQPNNCYYGQEITGTTCGTSNTIQCTPSANCPMPKCLGAVSQTNTQACTNGPPANGNTLNQNYGITFVGDQSACAAGTPCQYSCANGYVLQSGQCVILQHQYSFSCSRNSILANGMNFYDTKGNLVYGPGIGPTTVTAMSWQAVIYSQLVNGAQNCVGGTGTGVAYYINPDCTQTIPNPATYQKQQNPQFTCSINGNQTTISAADVSCRNSHLGNLSCTITQIS